MTNTGNNEGVRILDDFVCQAIRDPGVPKADGFHQGRSEGVQVVADLECEPANGEREAVRDLDAIRTGQFKSVALDDSIRSQINALAAWVVGTSNPRQSLSVLLQVLTDQVSEIERH
ncbi:MAG TPA: hypothetical protein VGM05_01195 [Planctomycetaceae bacterium]|jgi:hypothetical protein